MSSTRRRAHDAPVSSDVRTVVLVDDHPLWRETLKKVIERAGIGRVVAEASDGDEAVQTVLSHRPDVVVMDMGMPTLGGVEATRRIRVQLPDVKVLVLSSFEDKRSVLEAVRAGVSGYLLKTSGAKDVADAVARVAEGELVFPPKLANVVLGEFRRFSGGEPISVGRRVALAGDSVVHREGLAHVLAQGGFDVLGPAADAAKLGALIEADRPDVAILDFHASVDEGMRTAAKVREEHPSVPLLVLAHDVEASPALTALLDSSTGFGYLLRTRVADSTELGDAIHRVSEGGSVIDPAVFDKLVEPSGPAKLKDLTQREREVLALMAEGRSNQAISDRLFVSLKTLEKHVRAIFEKLNLEDTGDDHRRVLAVIAYLRSA